MLTNVDIQNKINQLRSQQSKRTEITADMVIKELAAVAFADRTAIAKVGQKGRIIFYPTEKLPEDVKKSITQIKRGKFGIEVVTADKVRALELLGKHLGIFDKRDDNADALAKLDEVLAKMIGGKK